MKRGARGSRRRPFLKLAIAVALLGWSLVTAREAEACMCRRPEHVCEAVNRADVVFSGKVLSVRLLFPEEGRMSPQLTTVEVQEVFLGKLGKQVQIYGEHCDDKFREGDVMLIYANQRGQALASRCSLTQPLATARGDLQELRALKDQTHGKVAGTLTYAAPDQTTKPLSGVSVRITSTDESRTETVTSDAQGNYQLEVPLDSYQLAIDAPRSLTATWLPHKPLQVRHPGACARGDISFKRNGVISGKVLGKLKKGVAGVAVYAVDASTPRQQGAVTPKAITDARGDYRIEGLAAGTYFVVVSPDGLIAESPYPTTYALGARTPDKAQRYDLTKALSAEATLVLPPPHPVHSVTLRVLQDGKTTRKPVEIINVSDEDYLFLDNPDKQGTVRLKALAGPIQWKVCLQELTEQTSKRSCATVELDLKRAATLDVKVPSAD